MAARNALTVAAILGSAIGRANNTASTSKQAVIERRLTRPDSVEASAASRLGRQPERLYNLSPLPTFICGSVSAVRVVAGSVEETFEDYCVKSACPD